MRNADELLEVIRPMIVEAWMDGKRGIEMDFSDPEYMLDDYAEWYRHRYKREPSERTLQRALFLNGLIAQAYAAGVAAREVAKS